MILKLLKGDILAAKNGRYYLDNGDGTYREVYKTRGPLYFNYEPIKYGDYNTTFYKNKLNQPLKFIPEGAKVIPQNSIREAVRRGYISSDLADKIDKIMKVARRFTSTPTTPGFHLPQRTRYSDYFNYTPATTTIAGITIHRGLNSDNKYLLSPQNTYTLNKPFLVLEDPYGTQTESTRSTGPVRPRYQIPEEYNTRDKIIELQETLKNLGYDLGKYGAKGDGIDGKWGYMTDAAYKKYMSNTEPILDIKGKKEMTPISFINKDKDKVGTLKDAGFVNGKGRLKTVVVKKDPEDPIDPLFSMKPEEAKATMYAPLKSYINNNTLPTLFEVPNAQTWEDLYRSNSLYKQGGKLYKFQDGGIGKLLNDTAKMILERVLLQKKTQNLTDEQKLQLQLAELGLYKGKIDGVIGNGTKKAIKKAEQMGYRVEGNKLVKLNFITKSSQKVVDFTKLQQPTGKLNFITESIDPIKLQLDSQIYTEIDPKDQKEFAQWLYKEGSSHSVNNALNVLAGLTQNFTGLGSKLPLTEGTRQQAIALHLFDDHNKIKTKDGIRHVIDKDGSGNYRWQQINGGESVHNDRSVFAKAMSQPGMHILGQYVTIETPEGYRIIDTYNFNKPGTDYAKNKITSGKNTSYDNLRYYAGNYGANKDLEINQFIPRDEVLKWYNDFKHGKGVEQRTKKIRKEYEERGFVGHGRQTYL